MLTVLPGGEEEVPAGGKSFKEMHAERNKQAQRRFRKRQKVVHNCWLMPFAPPYIIYPGKKNCEQAVDNE